jgi:hypothetical protein
MTTREDIINYACEIEEGKDPLIILNRSINLYSKDLKSPLLFEFIISIMIHLVYDLKKEDEGYNILNTLTKTLIEKRKYKELDKLAFLYVENQTHKKIYESICRVLNETSFENNNRLFDLLN